jgi:protocatechuate 3,4-dioxygenase beta subunit
MKTVIPRTRRSRFLREDCLVFVLFGVALTCFTVSLISPTTDPESLPLEPPDARIEPANGHKSTSQGTETRTEVQSAITHAQHRPAAFFSPSTVSDTPSPAAGSPPQESATTRSVEGPRTHAHSTGTHNADYRHAVTPSEEGHSIAGRVLDETGHSIPGVEIIATPLRLFDSQTQSSVPMPRLSTLSAPDGSFVFDALDDGEYRIESAQVPGLGVSRTTVRAGVEGITLMLSYTPSLWLHGIVADDAGMPLSGVAVESTPRENLEDASLSDDDGGYGVDLPFLQDRRFYTVRFKKDGYRGAVLRIDRDAPETIQALTDSAAMQVHVTLERLNSLSGVRGTVTTPTGDVVPGETVRLYSAKQNLQLTATTDREGRFELVGVPPSDDYRIRMQSANRYHEYLSDALQVGRNGADIHITLKPMGTGSFMGKMVDSNGEPVAGFSLWARSQNAGRGLRRITGDSRGHFFADGIPEGPLVLGTRSSPRFDITGASLVADSQRELTVVLDHGLHLLEGVALDEEGRPVAAAEVLLTWAHADNGLVSRSKRSMNADRDGHFQFTGLGPGPHRLKLVARGFEPLEVVLDVTDDPEPVLLHLTETSL